MISKRGDVPWILIALIIGIIFLLSVFIIPGKKIPQTFQDFQAIERELRDQWNTTFTSPTMQLTTEDLAFLRAYNSFIQELQACLRTEPSDCMCRASLPASSQSGHRIIFTKDPKIGFFAYPLRANSRTPLDSLTVLDIPKENIGQGYCFASYLQDKPSFASRFEIFFDKQRTIFQTPEQEVTSKELIYSFLIGGSEYTYLYSYDSGTPISFYKLSPHQLCVVASDSAILSSYANKPLCSSLPPTPSQTSPENKECEIKQVYWTLKKTGKRLLYDFTQRKEPQIKSGEELYANVHARNCKDKLLTLTVGIYQPIPFLADSTHSIHTQKIPDQDYIYSVPLTFQYSHPPRRYLIVSLDGKVVFGKSNFITIINEGIGDSMAKSYEQETSLQEVKNKAPQTGNVATPPPAQGFSLHSLSKQQITMHQDEKIIIKGTHFDTSSTIEVAILPSETKYAGTTSTWLSQDTMELTIPKFRLIPGKYNIRIVNGQGVKSNALELTVVSAPQQGQQVCTVEGYFAPQQYWGYESGAQLRPLTRKQGETATINLRTEGCDINNLHIDLYEADPLENDLVTRIPQLNIHMKEEDRQKKITATWETRYVDDGFLGGTPEIIAQVTLLDKTVLFTGQEKLVVLEQQATEAEKLKEKKWRWLYNGETYELDITIPKGMYEYYKAKPHPANMDYAYYVLDPGDDGVIEDLAKKLNALLARENIVDYEEKIYFASAFVQGNFIYKRDVETKQCLEYPRYPIELLAEGVGDCEDSAIITAAILEKMGIDVAILNLEPRRGYKSGHQTIAVACPKPKGQYYRDERGKTYCYFESTMYDEECRATLKQNYESQIPVACIFYFIGGVPQEFKERLDIENGVINKLIPHPFLSINDKWRIAYDDKTVNLKNGAVRVKNVGYIDATNIQITAIILGHDKTWPSDREEEIKRFQVAQINILNVGEERKFSFNTPLKFNKFGGTFRIIYEFKANNIPKKSVQPSDSIDV